MSDKCLNPVITTNKKHEESKCTKPKNIEWEECEICGNDQFKKWHESDGWNQVCTKCNEESFNFYYP